jgi:3-isopropylmalate/(R)-2-methylmalate dehydratase large subunit
MEEVRPGQFIDAALDVVLGNDITGPVAVREFARMGGGEVYDRTKVVLTPDHFTPNKDIKAAEQCKVLREFALEKGIVNYYEVGRVGVEHAFLPEQGLVTAGDVIIGADSHTCTYGALGAFSTGVGSTDMAAGMALGRAWFRVPSALKFVLHGAPGPWVTGKDLILHIIGRIGVDGALYRSMEFAGEGVAALSVESRLCVANMAIEAGAKNGIFPVDALALEYLAAHPCTAPGMVKTPRVYEADADAAYEAVYEIDLAALRPTVSFPSLPENTKTIDEAAALALRIDQVVIGSCTNGRMEDMEEAASVLRGRRVAEGVRCIVVPATQAVWLACVERGLAAEFVRAGCVFSTPTCGPCLGGYMGVLAEGERCVSTTNRNFVGRMGHVRSEVYLASPAVAAASAITGTLTSPERI